MRERMVINARGEFSLWRRILSNIVTLLMWAGWLLLWLPVLLKLRQVISLHMHFELAAIEVLDVITPVSLEHSIIALVGTSALLLLWSLLPSRSVTHAHALQALEDYSEYFELDEGEILAGRESRACIVHHDEHGNIVGIEPRTG